MEPSISKNIYIISIFVLLELLLSLVENCNCEHISTREHEQSVLRRYNGKRYIENVCPPDFIRLSNKCYYLSDTSEPWLDAFYKCKDKKSELAIINQAFEDRQLKKLLQKGKNNTRWIGGILNGDTWSWGKTAESITYNGFIKIATNLTRDGKLYCVAMDATKRYRWAPESCFNNNYFICQKLQNRRKPYKPSPMRKLHNDNILYNQDRRKIKSKNINKHKNNYELNNNVIPETQNDVAYPTNGNRNAFAYRKKPRRMVNVLKGISRRCRERDAVVLKHINSTLSDDECIKFFYERWQRRQQKAKDNRSKRLSRNKMNNITPKTLIQYRNSELHPARIEETHDVYIH